MNAKLSIAAVIATEAGGCDRVVREVAETLRRRGWRVRGLVQAREDREDCGGTSLIDLDDGTRYPIKQWLGSGSQSCALDPGLMANAGEVMKRIACEGADLAVFNRFGALEAAGEGFHAEMLALMASGTPVLVIVPDKHLAAWRHFTGGLSQELSADTDSLLAWFEAVRDKRTSDIDSDNDKGNVDKGSTEC